MTAKAFQDYSPLDDLGRCGRAMACLGPETMPDQPRGSIGMIRPSGWQIARYKDIDGTYLYNRCHLIGYQLSGQNANTLNLITGTRYMNMAGMEPFESRTAGYIETTGHHVLYRVTPVFEGEDLVARGVLMEARSVEDQDLQFCVYCYNVQPGIDIDYSDGSSRGKGYMGSGS
jgi:DNA-entry nuclease